MNILFYIAACIAIIATLRMIIGTNAVHSLLYLIVSLLSVSVIFFLLGAPFIAALEVIIYAGAIMVLFVFVIMMLNTGSSGVKKEHELLKPSTWIGPGITSGILFGEMLYVLMHPASHPMTRADTTRRHWCVAFLEIYIDRRTRCLPAGGRSHRGLSPGAERKAVPSPLFKKRGAHHMTIPMEYGLLLAAILFCIGLAGVLVRRDVIFMLMSVEVMLNAAGLAFIVGGAARGSADGQVMFLFILAMAAAEVSVGLALIIQLYQKFKTLDADSASGLNG